MKIDRYAPVAQKLLVLAGLVAAMGASSGCRFGPAASQVSGLASGLGAVGAGIAGKPGQPAAPAGRDPGSAGPSSVTTGWQPDSRNTTGGITNDGLPWGAGV